jgi:rubrerythrin
MNFAHIEHFCHSIIHDIKDEKRSEWEEKIKLLLDQNFDTSGLGRINSEQPMIINGEEYESDDSLTGENDKERKKREKDAKREQKRSQQAASIFEKMDASRLNGKL